MRLRHLLRSALAALRHPAHADIVTDDQLGVGGRTTSGAEHRPASWEDQILESYRQAKPD